MTSPTAQYTDFSRDVLGRYICNGFDEAIQSAQGAGSRPFDIIIVGGGSFASALAQHTRQALGAGRLRSFLRSSLGGWRSPIFTCAVEEDGHGA